MAEAQFIADQNFTTTDSTVWDRLPSIAQPVLLLDGSLVGALPGEGERRGGIEERAAGGRLYVAAGWQGMQHDLMTPDYSFSRRLQDAPVPPINARLIAGQLPDARVLYFDGWGHGLVVEEAGSRLANITAQFLSGSEPEGAFAVNASGAAAGTAGTAGTAGAPDPTPTPSAPANGAAAGSVAVLAAALAGAAALLA